MAIQNKKFYFLPSFKASCHYASSPKEVPNWYMEFKVLHFIRCSLAIKTETSISIKRYFFLKSLHIYLFYSERERHRAHESWGQGPEGESQEDSALNVDPNEGLNFMTLRL